VARAGQKAKLGQSPSGRGQSVIEGKRRVRSSFKAERSRIFVDQTRLEKVAKRLQEIDLKAPYKKEEAISLLKQAAADLEAEVKSNEAAAEHAEAALRRSKQLYDLTRKRLFRDRRAKRITTELEKAIDKYKEVRIPGHTMPEIVAARETWNASCQCGVKRIAIPKLTNR